MLGDGRPHNGPEGPDWAVVVPLSEVPDPARCPVWPLSEARAKLGEVVDATTSFLSPMPQVLARHRQPVAAVIDARTLSDLPGEVDRMDLQALLEEGGSITLTYDPGQSGRCDELGDVIDEPIDPAFVATALGWDGAVIGSDPASPSPRPCCGSTAAGRPSRTLGDAIVYSGEAPF